MKIIAPTSRIEEIPQLAESGADELYCGVVPDEWIEKFGVGGVNRRAFGNLRGLSELERATAAAELAGCELSLVMNAQQYSDRYIESLVALAQRFNALGGKAIIVADLGLMSLLREECPGLNLHLSSVASCRNSEGARLAGALGAKRVVLPRDITLAELSRMCKANPRMEFEAFVLNDGCVFEEGVCHTVHLPGALGGPICMDRYETNYRQTDAGASALPVAMEAVSENEKFYEQWLWFRMGCGFSLTKSGLPYGPCGLCAIPALMSFGVAAIKIAGREAPTPRKVASIGMVRRVLDMAENGDPATVIVDFAKGMRGEAEHCNAGYMCYYR